MKKALLFTAITTIISYSASAQAAGKDRLANIELTAQQKTSIDSVRKSFDEKRSALKKDASLSAEALVTKRKELQKEQVSVVNTFLTTEQRKQIKKLNKAKAKKED